MKNNFRQYEWVLSSVSEVAEVLSNMEGGAFILAWTAELICDLVETENFEGAFLAVQKLCEASGVEGQRAAQEEQRSVDEKIWLGLFTEALMDQAEMAAVK